MSGATRARHWHWWADKAAWEEALPLLERGEPLVRSDRTRLFYVHGLGGISDRCLAQLLSDGTLVGVPGEASDGYVLADHGCGAGA